MLDRCGSWLYALVPPLIFFLLFGIFDPVYGAPSKLPDLPAALLLGAAQFALYSAFSRKSLAWFSFSGILLGAASLTRFHAWIYGAFVLAPMLIAFTWMDFMAGERRPARLLAPVLLFTAAAAGLSGWFVLGVLDRNLEFYAAAGYALNSSLGSACSTTGAKLISHLFGIPALSVVALIGVAYAAIRWRGLAGLDVRDLAIVSWGAAAVPLLVLVILRVEDDYTQTYYALPGLLFFAAAPFASRSRERAVLPEFARLSTFLVIVLPMLVAATLTFQLKSENFLYPRPKDAAQKDYSDHLAELVAASLPRPHETYSVPVVDSNFDYSARLIVPLIWSRFNRLSVFGNVFQIRQSQWSIAYGENEQDIRSRTVAALTYNVDLFAALNGVPAAKADEAFKDAYTQRMARYIDEFLSSRSHGWEERGAVQGPLGRVVLYKNHRRQALLTDADKALQALHDLLAASDSRATMAPVFFPFRLPDQVLDRWKGKLDVSDGRIIHTAFAMDRFPGEKMSRLLNRWQKNSGFVVALSNPDSAQTPYALPGGVERLVALRVLEALRGAPHVWNPIGAVASPWGELAIFRAHGRSAGGFWTDWFSGLFESNR